MNNQAKHLEVFNEKVKKLLNEVDHPNVSFLKKAFGEYSDFYTAIDSLGFKYGIEINTRLFSDEYGNEGYIPMLKYGKNNLRGREFGFEKLLTNAVNLDDCYASLAKSWLYVIMNCDLDKLKDYTLNDRTRK